MPNTLPTDLIYPATNLKGKQKVVDIPVDKSKAHEDNQESGIEKRKYESNEKMMFTREKSRKDSNEIQHDAHFAVDHIVIHVRQNSETHYIIVWFGYSTAYNTIEPAHYIPGHFV